ncbi:MAG: nuclear transport factor 2 family protein [Alphaproteobacteria bacterium]|nr:nuclear transport factor 2 family protein [Alphaproteobacteria bacterium]
MDGTAAPDVTLERLHEIADAFARHDVDGIVGFFAEDGEFRNAKGPHHWGQSFKGRAAIRSYFVPLFAGTSDVNWRHTSEFICGNRAVTEWHRHASERRASGVAGLRPLYVPARLDRDEGHLRQSCRLIRIPSCWVRRVWIMLHKYTA